MVRTVIVGIATAIAICVTALQAVGCHPGGSAARARMVENTGCDASQIRVSRVDDDEARISQVDSRPVEVYALEGCDGARECYACRENAVRGYSCSPVRVPGEMEHVGTIPSWCLRR